MGLAKSGRSGQYLAWTGPEPDLKKSGRIDRNKNRNRMPGRKLG